MENKTDLIERLRKIANELENECKPEFEVGKVYYSESHKIYVTNCDNINSVSGYGFTDNNWKTFKSFSLVNISVGKLIPCPAELWEKALTKEAVKRGLVKGCTIEPSNGKIYLNNNNGYGISSSNSNVFLLCNYPIMEYGIWATVIKERSLEEWLRGYYNTTGKLSIPNYIKQTKTELIKILKNLPND